MVKSRRESCIRLLLASVLIITLCASQLLLTAPVLTTQAFAETASVVDKDFVVQKYVEGICCGSATFAFVDPDDILVLEKISGEVHIIHKGTFDDLPVLKENVTSTGEQGMLTIATLKNKVYLYFTESAYNGGPPLGKRVYSYDWTGSRLVNKTLIKDMPQTQNYHNGGAMTFDRNGSLYIAIGDAGRYGKLENHPDGEPDDTGVIMRLVPTGPYYAMGLRNSFGLTTDPITGSLWDTENGESVYDEVNFVPPGFNSGWDVIMGPSNASALSKLPGYPNYTYRDPVFSWQKTVAPTGIAFAAISQPFAKYNDSVFVGDFNNGNLYRFRLNSARDGFAFETSSPLADKVANTGDSLDSIIFGRGFNGITDVKFGPDGFLYILSYGDGTLYRIIPASMQAANSVSMQSGIGQIQAVLDQSPIIAIVVATSAAGTFVAWRMQRRRLGSRTGAK